MVNTQIKELELVEEQTSTQNTHVLLVWNDDVNSFDWVILALVEICAHSFEQAEQCANIIHNKGKYAVKHGILKKLRPMCEALLDRGISASLEER
ncbi:MAG: ATP-dependent Clp protease adaptor ClpS [Bacteroidia bacterium]